MSRQSHHHFENLAKSLRGYNPGSLYIHIVVEMNLVYILLYRVINLQCSLHESKVKLQRPLVAKLGPVRQIRCCTGVHHSPKGRSFVDLGIRFVCPRELFREPH